MNKQQALEDAFAWVRQAYSEATAMLGDALRLLQHDRWEMVDWRGMEVVSGSKQGDPYFAPRAACHFLYYGGDENAAHGVGVFVGANFYCDRAAGPLAFGGTVEWTDRTGKPNNWLINATACEPGWEGRFSWRRDGEIYVHSPTDEGRRKHAGIGSVSHFELPLTGIDSPQRLESLVGAIVALRSGQAEMAKRLVRELTTD